MLFRSEVIQIVWERLRVSSVTSIVRQLSVYFLVGCNYPGGMEIPEYEPQEANSAPSFDLWASFSPWHEKRPDGGIQVPHSSCRHDEQSLFF